MSAKVKISGFVADVGSRTSRSGYTTNFVVVDDSGTNAKYPNPIEIEAKDPVAVNKGDIVDVEFFVNGRAWTKDGETRYFVSLKLASIIITKKAGPAHLADDYEATSKGALQAWLDKGNTEPKKNFGPYCKGIVNKASSKEYTEEDWKAVIASLWPPRVDDDDGADFGGDEIADDAPF